jgi:hypothetical protein
MSTQQYIAMEQFNAFLLNFNLYLITLLINSIRSSLIIIRIPRDAAKFTKPRNTKGMNIEFIFNKQLIMFSLDVRTRFVIAR